LGQERLAFTDPGIEQVVDLRGHQAPITGILTGGLQLGGTTVSQREPGRFRIDSSVATVPYSHPNTTVADHVDAVDAGLFC
jgi:hypothetical protein